MSDETIYVCPYCGCECGSESGTPSDIECCGEIGHAVTAEEYEAEELNGRWKDQA